VQRSGAIAWMVILGVNIKRAPFRATMRDVYNTTVRFIKEQRLKIALD
jgi:hypothetical protein